jgi:hypothetical protein
VLSGIYEARTGTRQLLQAIPPELLDLLDLPLSEKTVFATLMTWYMIFALGMIGVVIKTGQGKSWARLLLLISFIADVAMSLFSSYQGPADYAILVVNLGLQIAALGLLFTSPAREWFEKRG